MDLIFIYRNHSCFLTFPSNCSWKAIAFSDFSWPVVSTISSSTVNVASICHISELLQNWMWWFYQWLAVSLTNDCCSHEKAIFLVLLFRLATIYKHSGVQGILFTTLEQTGARYWMNKMVARAVVFLWKVKMAAEKELKDMKTRWWEQ